MNNILFTLLYILGPEISTARKYLIVDLDALRQLDLNSHGTRRQTDNIIEVQQPKDFLKSVISILQSYDEDQLNDGFNSLKNKLSDLNIDDTNFNEAKEFVLNVLHGTHTKDLLHVTSEMLEDNNYDDQINNAYNSFRNQLTGLKLDDATLNIAKELFLSKLSQVQEKPGKPVRLFIRTRNNEQKVRRLLDRFTPRKSRDEPKINILDTIKAGLRSVADFFFKPKESSRSDGYNLTPEEEEQINKLVEKLQNTNTNEGKGNWIKDAFGKIVDKLKNVGEGDKSDWKKDIFGKLASQLQNPGEGGDKTDWKNLLTNFLKDAKGNDSLSWLASILKKLASNDKAWEVLGKYSKGIKPAGRDHGVHLAF